MPDETKTDDTEKFDREKILSQLKKWREKLLDLSKGNPLLGINRSRMSKLKITSPSCIDLFDLLALQAKELKLPLIERKLAKKRDEIASEQSTFPEMDSSEEKTKYTVTNGDVEFLGEPKDLFRLIKRVYDNGRLTLEERGVTTLHVTIGTLSWNDPLLGESSAPLLLIPCELHNTGSSSALKLKMSDEELQVNPSLELFLRERHKLTLPSFPEQPGKDSVKKFLDDVRSLVSEKGWAVQEDGWLSTFSFESLVLFKDLLELTERACVNPLIASLAHAGHIPDFSEALGDNIDDLPVPEAVPIPVMTADASQLKVLSSVVSGKHVVIHGPPGTGKSQTITNLIADSLGRGQKVLFVSAKMAALNVVFERLERLGLGRFCLEAHSTKAGKAKIIDELKKTLEAPISGKDETLKAELENLIKVRKQLNDYVSELHQKREPLGETIFGAIGKVESLAQIEDVEFDLPWEEISLVERPQINEKTELLDQLTSMAETFDKQASHPWRGFMVRPDQKVDDEKIKKNLELVLFSIEKITEYLDMLGALIKPSEEIMSFEGLKRLSSVLESVSKCEKLPEGWQKIGLERTSSLSILFETAGEKAEKIAELKERLSESTNLSAAEMKKLLDPLDSKYKTWTRTINPDFWKFQKEIKKSLRQTVRPTYSALSELLKTATLILKTDAWFKSNKSDLSTYLSESMDSPDKLKKMSDGFKTSIEIKQAISSKILLIPEAEAQISKEIQESSSMLIEALNDKSRSEVIKTLDSYWMNGISSDKHIEELDLKVLSDRLEEIIKGVNRLHEWRSLQLLLEKCSNEGLQSLISHLGLSGVQSASQIFKKRFYSKWAKEIIESSEVLRDYSGALYAEKINRFRDIDARLQKLALKRICYRASESTLRVTMARPGVSSSEIGILRREIQKKRRFKPLRKLFKEIPHVLQAIKPCMLMSPISVSTFLDTENAIDFDLVVFDEASQLPTQEAIPAILRAKQVVVAGDENQLPPTTFFRSSFFLEEDEDEDEYEPLESLLDDCVSVPNLFAEAHIIWHYRSMDERLIKFSNHYFYDNRLITFPTPKISAEGAGVQFVYTPSGTWDKGKSRTNRVEARKVAEVVIDQLNKYPDRSLGVVALNVSQKEAIELAIDELIKTKPKVAALLDSSRENGFFVKSLENVQGDERDTIIISVGYAKTTDGSLSLNFGPLNRDGGWRRLNVLITRAKWQTILVSSILSHELDAINSVNKGAYMLRNFIEYAEKGCQLPTGPIVETDSETNDFEDSIATALRDRGCIVDEQVGASGYRLDLAIRDPRDLNRYLMAVECDGATYHSAITARDRDILREDVLRSQGWKICRVWSTDWFRDSERELTAILKFRDNALREPVSSSKPVPKGKRIDDEKAGETEVYDEEPKRTTNRKYQKGSIYKAYYTKNRHFDPNILLKNNNYFQLAQIAAEIINIETPIHKDLLIERLKEAFNLSRAGNNIRGNVEDAIDSLKRHRNFLVKNDFIYYSDKTISGFRVPSSELKRDLLWIAQEEIEQAILYLVEDQFGYPKKELPKAIYELFGLSRMDSQSSDRILSIAEELIDNKKLKLSGFTLYVE